MLRWKLKIKLSVLLILCLKNNLILNFILNIETGQMVFHLPWIFDALY